MNQNSLMEGVKVHSSKPLADRMRPRSLDDVVGQEHLTGPDQILRRLLENPPEPFPSLLLWGTPGTGKTTLAKIVASSIDYNFIELSAVEAGVGHIRDVVKSARDLKLRPRLDQQTTVGTILFLDEIHRFNKAQQDYLLPHVEQGLITLIGATTEKPSFEVNPALLSRSRVLTLKSLEPESIVEIVKHAIPVLDDMYEPKKIDISDDMIRYISQLANADARTALNILELSVQLSQGGAKKKVTLTEPVITQAAQSTTLAYDKSGEEHYNTISAFIKSMRASDVDAAMYYLARMVEAGEDPKFIARRMVIFASEDIGMANPNALLMANEVFRACESIGYPECAINLAHGVAYLAQSKKDRRAYDALRAAQKDVEQYQNLPIPLKLRNAPTKLMQDEGYGEGYEMYPEGENLLPDKLKGRKYFK